MPAIELHAVRHTYATTALRAGINPKLVSARLGHSSVAFTLDTYTDSVPELDRAAAEQVSRLFFALPEPTANDTDQGLTAAPEKTRCLPIRLRTSLRRLT